MLKNSNMVIFIINREGKFINAVEGLTIFIDKKIMMEVFNIFIMTLPKQQKNDLCEKWIYLTIMIKKFSTFNER